MKFPAVTFCNLNPMRKDRLQKMIRSQKVRHRRSLMSEQQGLDGLNYLMKLNTPNDDETQQFVGDSPPGSPIPSNYSNKPKEKWRLKLNLHEKKSDVEQKDKTMFYMNILSPDVLSNVTYSLSDILIDCSFQGRHCDFDRDFVRVMNPRYGACYVFNSGMLASMTPVPYKNITNSGTDNGLELTLFVDVDNYLPGISDVAGYRLLIHDQRNPPMPDRDGFVLHPGAYTMLGLRSNTLQRAEEPYGMCKHFTKADNESMNMFLDSLPLTSPSMTTCMRTCEQSEIMFHCGCFSLNHGYSSALAFKTLNVSARKRPCFMDYGSSDFKCVIERLQEVTKPDRYCKMKLCRHIECESRRFDASQSIASWPTANSFEAVRKLMRARPIPMQNYERLVTDKGNDSLRNFKHNFLKVLVYFEDLTEIRIQAKPAYGYVDFLSDLGGQGGLWLGISAFTIVELFVLIVELVEVFFVRVCNACCGRKQVEKPAEKRLEMHDNSL